MLIRFDFIGGPKDGETIYDVPYDCQFGLATAYYHATFGGAPGALLWCRTEYLIELTDTLSESAIRDLWDNGSPLRGHLYEVFCRSRGASDVHIRVRHVCAVPKGVPPRDTLRIDQPQIAVSELPFLSDPAGIEGSDPTRTP
jgi:hypothetical protein